MRVELQTASRGRRRRRRTDLRMQARRSPLLARRARRPRPRVRWGLVAGLLLPSGNNVASTAGDQVRLAMAALGRPAFAQTVAMSRVTLPVAGPQANKDTLLGRDGRARRSPPAAASCSPPAARWTAARSR